MSRGRIIALLLIMVFFFTTIVQLVTHNYVPDYNDYYVDTMTVLSVYTTTSLSSTYETYSSLYTYVPLTDADRTGYIGFIKIALLLLLLFTSFIIVYHRKKVTLDEF